MREKLISWLAISERPDPPPGAGATLSTFRASPRYLHYSVLAWLPKQAVAFAGLVFSLAFFGTLDQDFLRPEGWMRFLDRLEDIRFGFLGFGTNLRALIGWFEWLAILAFVAQLIFTGLLLKLSWELRWYMVGEQALRIREGLWSLREQTMTIANIQTMIVRQGPLQRLLGISDLEIHTAGGGGGAEGQEGEGGSQKSRLHIGRIQGVEDAVALRDRIAEQLKRHRGAGLGDRDDDSIGTAPGAGGGALEAANDVLAAVGALAGEIRRDFPPTSGSRDPHG